MYIHFPQPRNIHVYRHENNKLILYFYEDSSCKGNTGSWRTSSYSSDLDETDPNSEIFGWGNQYPRYCFNSSDKYSNYSSESEPWSIEFYTESEYLQIINNQLKSINKISDETQSTNNDADSPSNQTIKEFNIDDTSQKLVESLYQTIKE